jgi:probable phosphoglycerate mutase
MQASYQIRRKKLKRPGRDLKSLLVLLRVSVSSTWRFWRWRLHLHWHPEQEKESIQTTRMKQTLLFIRHGQTTWNVQHLLPGQLPGIPLTATGREQAERLAEALMVLPITAVISSPLERAHDTAAFLGRACALPVLQEEGLVDTNVGPWAGKDYNELQKSDPLWKQFTRDPTQAPEGVENFIQVQQRVVAAVEHWLKQPETGNYPAFVAHADVVKLLLAYYIGLDITRAGWLSIDNASVSMVELEEEQRPRVVAIGWNPRPGWLAPPEPPVIAGTSAAQAPAAPQEKPAGGTSA